MKGFCCFSFISLFYYEEESHNPSDLLAPYAYKKRERGSFQSPNSSSSSHTCPARSMLPTRWNRWALNQMPVARALTYRNVGCKKPCAWPTGMLVANEDQRVNFTMYLYLTCVVGRIMHPTTKRCPCSNSQTYEYVWLHGRKVLETWLRWRISAVRRFTWVTQVKPIQSHDSLKAEILSLAVVRESNGMTEDAAGEIWSIKETQLTVGSSEDGGWGPPKSQRMQGPLKLE